MPIEIAIVTKVKPIFLDNLKTGKLVISSPLKGAQLANNLKIGLRATAEAIKTDPEAAKGTELKALIVLQATTSVDKTPSNVCIIVPPSKAGQYKPYLKEITKVVKKGNKQISICKFTFEGKMEGDNIYLNVSTPPTAKMKMTPVLKWLNKLGKPMGLRFETVETVVEAPSNTATTATEEVSQETPKQEEQPQEKKPADPKEKVEALIKRQKALAKTDYSLSQVMELMARCQELRVDPKAKGAFKTDETLLKQFKMLRKVLINMVKSDDDLYNELESNLQDPLSITKQFQVELDDLWDNFATMTQDAESFQDILKQNTTTLILDIKKFQKEVEAQAKGMLEASKFLKIGDPLAISKAMTAIRSGIVKLKDAMKTKVSNLQKLAKAMAKLEADFRKTTEQSIQESIIGKLETMTQQFSKESETVAVFN